jgi:hypothetical protein
MNTPTKLGGYALGLVAVFGAAAGIGAAVGPVGLASEEVPHTSDTRGGSPDTGTHGDPESPSAPTDGHTSGMHDDTEANRTEEGP